MNKKAILYLAMAMVVVACEKQAKQGDKGSSADVRTETTVETMTLKRSSFNIQLVCNGRLHAIARSELTFPGQGIVTGIFVHNGSRVRKGDLLAETDKREKRMALEKCEKDMERASIELSDKLIGLGYNGMDDDVPADVMRRAKVTSGYFTTAHQLATARKDLADCELRAPFGGRVADLACQPFQKADKFGLLIDDSFFDVKFCILEAELSSISVGQTVKVTPFVNAAKVLMGKVTRINPTVDEKGLVSVEARIKNTAPLLIDGMNVRVVVEKTVAGKFVVPKSAVVERDGYYVVFEVEDSVAVWTYVDVEHTNLDSYAITGCKSKGTILTEGEKVIISNNQNLADGTIVKSRKSSR